MHAVVVRVTIADPEAATQQLREEVVPQVSQAPGFVAGYWTRKDNSGLGITIWETEENAQAVGERIRGLVPEGVTLEDIEVREVVASA